MFSELCFQLNDCGLGSQLRFCYCTPEIGA
uniref:Uncharacterized protein n=1 Tax=Anguilla anguilla TaxID=7936 RepID=A0A0E9PPH1_ANGAN